MYLNLVYCLNARYFDQEDILLNSSTYCALGRKAQRKIILIKEPVMLHVAVS